MWMPKFIRNGRQTVETIEAISTERLASSERATVHARQAAQVSNRIADRSRELEQANNISAIIARSLGIPHHTAKER